jgi:hypothetical protein
MDWIALGFAVTLFLLVTAPSHRDPLDLADD